jgi:hypothetical protein
MKTKQINSSFHFIYGLIIGILPCACLSQSQTKSAPSMKVNQETTSTTSIPTRNGSTNVFVTNWPEPMYVKIKD